MNNNTQASSSGIGFTGLLTIVFIVLKLTGVISWSWVWVLSPLWIGFALIILILIIGSMIMAGGFVTMTAGHLISKVKKN